MACGHHITCSSSRPGSHSFHLKGKSLCSWENSCVPSAVLCQTVPSAFSLRVGHLMWLQALRVPSSVWRPPQTHHTPHSGTINRIRQLFSLLYYRKGPDIKSINGETAFNRGNIRLITIKTNITIKLWKTPSSPEKSIMKT